MFFVTFSWWYIQLPLASLHTPIYLYVSIFSFLWRKETVRSTVQLWTPGGREAVQKAEAIMQDWTVRHKSDKGENCEGRQLRRKEDFAVTVLWKTNEERVTLCAKKHVWVLVSKSLNRFWFSKKWLYRYYKHGPNYLSAFFPDSRFREMKSESVWRLLQWMS